MPVFMIFGDMKIIKRQYLMAIDTFFHGVTILSQSLYHTVVKYTTKEGVLFHTGA
jgi:hypothetical protein